MSGHQRSIDGLRGIVILLVIMFHRDVAYFGWTGVILFFVLSGYLITNVLFTEKDKQIPLRSKFRNFWMRRLLRIFPLCYLYLFILFLGLIVKMVPSGIGTELPALFTYTYNFYLIWVYDQAGPSFLAGHFWSLSIEEQFYIFYPFLIFLFNRRQIKIATVGLILFSIVFRIFSYVDVSDMTHNFSAELDYHPFSYIDSFLCGGAIFIFKLDKLKPVVGFFSLAISFFLLIISGLFVYLELFENYRFNVFNYLSNFGIVAHYCSGYYCVWMPVCLNFLFSSVLLVLLLPTTNTLHQGFKRIFEVSFLTAIGKVSYGMYIFHAMVIWIMLQVFDQKLINKYLLFLLCLLGTWLISFVTYHLYEKKFLALKEKFK